MIDDFSHHISMKIIELPCLYSVPLCGKGTFNSALFPGAPKGTVSGYFLLESFPVLIIFYNSTKRETGSEILQSEISSPGEKG